MPKKRLVPQIGSGNPNEFMQISRTVSLLDAQQHHHHHDYHYDYYFY